MPGKMTYKSSGVDYDAMDNFKRLAQAAARETAFNIRRFGFSEVEMSRGESVYLIETPDSYLAHVEEGLGTKNLVADAMHCLTGKSYYDHIAQCAVGMIVNDMITLGAIPLSASMHLSVGSSRWFKDKNRYRDLINGWERACMLARCNWGGGETATLHGSGLGSRVLLGGSAIGIVRPKDRLIQGNVQHGDAIILIESSGIHANGLTMAREIAKKLPEGYLTKLPDGRSYGETLLDPTHIYVGLVEDCLNSGVNIHYAVNITGHGWRKLMRLNQPFAYIIERLPKQLPIFDFIQKHGPVDDAEAYANFNMGAGFTLFMPEAEAEKVLLVARSCGLEALLAGYIERSSEKKVIVTPKNLEYLGPTLNIR